MTRADVTHLIAGADESHTAAMARLWHDVWHEVHPGHVPEELRNLRARHSYDSRGRIDTGACINEAETGGGAVLGVPAHRYVERLTKEARS